MAKLTKLPLGLRIQETTPKFSFKLSYNPCDLINQFFFLFFSYFSVFCVFVFMIFWLFPILSIFEHNTIKFKPGVQIGVATSGISLICQIFKNSLMQRSASLAWTTKDSRKCLTWSLIFPLLPSNLQKMSKEGGVCMEMSNAK